MRNIVKNRNRGFAMPLIALVISMFFAGCQLFGPAAPSKPGDQVIREGMAKLLSITAFGYEVALKGDVKDEAGTANKFDLTLAGQVDVKDAKDPKVTLKVNGSLSAGEGMGGKGSLDFRMNKAALYFNIMELTIDGGEEMPAEITTMFKKWWMVTLPPEAADEIAKSMPQAEESKMTPEQLKVKKAMEETNFFGTPTYVGVENVKGEDCYKYKVTLDKKAFVAFMQKAAEAQGESVSAEEVADLEKSLETVAVTGDVYVSTKSGMLHKFAGTVKMTGGEGEPSGTFDVALTLSDVGKAVSIDAPKDATEFPVADFMQGFMGGYGAATELDTSVTDFEDPSLLMDGGQVTEPLEGGENEISG